ncbi:MAG TPA: CRISPR-associated endonuclease Cas2 [Candidatus Hydrogenedentes bacterium]|nr:CRISPR-associated endonuclease Cas2 [Candidatus Hydrogenedentota bacterium]
MDTERLKMGWLLVGFDLPVGTPDQRKRATDFRKFLLEDGFLMIQFSLYARPCVSFARQETHVDRVRKSIPEEGNVRILFITRAQWDRSFVIQGNPATDQPPEAMPEQFMLW